MSQVDTSSNSVLVEFGVAVKKSDVRTCVRSTPRRCDSSDSTGRSITGIIESG